MARLAAYYQEEFHYVPTGYGSKQKKAAYIAYGEQPKNNVFHGGYLDNRHRLNNLALSDPALSPCPYPQSMAGTLRRSPYDGHQLARYPQNIEYPYDFPEHYSSQQNMYLENELMQRNGRYAQDGRYTVRPRSASRDKICKRLVYDEPWNDFDAYGNPVPLDNVDRYHGRYQNGHATDVWHPNINYRSDSSHGRWQQWPWASEETYYDPNLLSPPSPLDSGLSSQSITSSPSLEADCFPAHPDQYMFVRSSKSGCLCHRNGYPESMLPQSPHHFRADSPGAASTRSKRMVQVKNKINANSIYGESLHAIPLEEQVRYGKLGLLSESACNSQALATIPKYQDGNTLKSYQIKAKRSKSPFVYGYIDENGVAFMKKPPSHIPEGDQKRPKSRLEITEANSDKDSSDAEKKKDGEHSDKSDKSPEPESSVSLAVSTSNSSSMSSNNADLVNMEPKRGRSSKKTEKGIRELEDMYQKCNLGDKDLLDRAERRDLPTAHQTRVDHVGGLTRSKSDTLYEVLSAGYQNPYHKPQRAPPSRRAGIPDKVADDMALRKHRKNSISSIPRPNDHPVTYMLCSSHFTPTISSGRDILMMDNPDIEYDDFSYRTHYLGRKDSLNEVQPPFGIPLRPPPPQRVFSDYLHAMPSGGLPPLCHPRRNPDVVRDDMAFRTLRKDDPERAYYDTASMYKKLR